MRLSPRNLAAAGLLTLLPALAFGGGIPTSTQWLEEVIVSGKLERLGGDPASATVGVATSEQLDLRPVLATLGEIIGVVVLFNLISRCCAPASCWKSCPG